MALDTVTVACDLGAAASGGEVTFTPSDWVTSAADHRLLPPSEVTATLDGSGTGAADLVMPDPDPRSWHVSVTKVPGVPTREWDVVIDPGVGSPQELSDLVEIVPGPASPRYLLAPDATPTAGQVFTATGAGQLGEWDDAAEGGGAVDSVNGQTGVVVLDSTDVGADPAGSAATAQTAAIAAAEASASDFTTTAVGTETSRAMAAEALKAPLASPALTGTPTAPTASQANNSTQLATTAYTDTGLAAKAPLASPALTGNPTAPTQSAGNNSTRLATTAYADGAVATETTRATTAEGLKAPLASPALTGNPTAPTQTAADNSTKLATTAYADASSASAVAPKIQTLTDGSSIAVDLSAGRVARLVLGGAHTLANPTNPVDGQEWWLEVTQDGTGGRVLSYGTASAFATTLPSPNLSTGAGALDILKWRYNAGKGKHLLIGYVLGF